MIRAPDFPVSQVQPQIYLQYQIFIIQYQIFMSEDLDDYSLSRSCVLVYGSLVWFVLYAVLGDCLWVDLKELFSNRFQQYEQSRLLNRITAICFFVFVISWKEWLSTWDNTHETIEVNIPYLNSLYREFKGTLQRNLRNYSVFYLT